ncbi:MAG: Nif3-like dinuclear metal center hexameric protein [Bacteroidetes bacterium]|nr:Nif3-like dinuclear metal center hexameric protein [Bacteroidota bacterium]
MHNNIQIIDIIQELESIAPASYQESYDNSGLIVGSSDWACTGVICTLDATEAVVLEAKSAGCNLIVAHHPIIFGGLKQLNGKNYVEKTVISAIKHDIAIYAIHTNLDNILDGVNNTIADRLGLIHKKILAPKLGVFPNLNIDNQYVGSGMIAELPEPMEEIGFLQMLQTSFDLPIIRHTPLLGKPIQKVALCGGSGSFLLNAAKAAGADIYISADFKYHEFFDAEGQIVIADIGHWESEQFTVGLLIDILQAKFPTFAVLKSVIKTNPVNYFL